MRAGADKKRTKDRFSDLYRFTLYNALAHAPARPGVYYLISRRAGDNYTCFYIGHDRSIRSDLIMHMNAASTNNRHIYEGVEKIKPHNLMNRLLRAPLDKADNQGIKRQIDTHPCLFMFILINSPAKRSQFSRRQIQKYRPAYNPATRGSLKKAEAASSRSRKSRPKKSQALLDRVLAC
jgi:hypothetical protein